ncbi:hypothetical protein [Streptomyces antarcticus]|nr:MULTISPECIES: hypothetical protein [unclassified Streptomyces]MCY0944305.1 hypothetical protein [Streptomyces sp. H34-AA3]MCZ4087381.1 hypothetical protein [Streptomyces sp. H34-S5]
MTARAAEIVRGEYSIEAAASAFASVYAGLAGRAERECLPA